MAAEWSGPGVDRRLPITLDDPKYPRSRPPEYGGLGVLRRRPRYHRQGVRIGCSSLRVGSRICKEEQIDLFSPRFFARSGYDAWRRGPGGAVERTTNLSAFPNGSRFPFGVAVKRFEIEVPDDADASALEALQDVAASYSWSAVLSVVRASHSLPTAIRPPERCDVCGQKFRRRRPDNVVRCRCPR